MSMLQCSIDEGRNIFRLFNTSGQYICVVMYPR